MKVYHDQAVKGWFWLVDNLRNCLTRFPISGCLQRRKQVCQETRIDSSWASEDRKQSSMTADNHMGHNLVQSVLTHERNGSETQDCSIYVRKTIKASGGVPAVWTAISKKSEALSMAEKVSSAGQRAQNTPQESASQRVCQDHVRDQDSGHNSSASTDSPFWDEEDFDFAQYEAKRSRDEEDGEWEDDSERKKRRSAFQFPFFDVEYEAGSAFSRLAFAPFSNGNTLSAFNCHGDPFCLQIAESKNSTMGAFAASTSFTMQGFFGLDGLGITDQHSTDGSDFSFLSLPMTTSRAGSKCDSSGSDKVFED